MAIGCPSAGFAIAAFAENQLMLAAIVGVLALAVLALAPWGGRKQEVLSTRERSEPDPGQMRLGSRLATLALVYIVAADYRYFQSTTEGARSLGALASVEGILRLAAFAFLGVSIIAGLMAVSGKTAKVSPIGKPVAVFVVYAAYMTVSSVQAPDPVFSMIGGIQLVCLALLTVLLVRSGVAAIALDFFARRYVLLTLGSAAFNLIVPDSGYDRYSWANLGPVASGTFAAMAAVVLIALLLSRAESLQPSRHVLKWLTAAALIVLIATIARSATVALIATCALLFAVSITGTRRLLRILAIACGALVLAYGVFPLVYDFISRGQSENDIATLTGRTELWDANWKLIAVKPIFGYGFLSTRTLFKESFDLGASHNVFLEALTNGGIVGAALLLMTAGLAVATLRRRRGTPGSIVHARYLVSVGILTFLVINGLTSSGFASGVGNQLVCFAIVTAYAATPTTRELSDNEERDSDQFASVC